MINRLFQTTNSHGSKLVVAPTLHKCRDRPRPMDCYQVQWYLLKVQARQDLNTRSSMLFQTIVSRTRMTPCRSLPRDRKAVAEEVAVVDPTRHTKTMTDTISNLVGD